MKLHFALFLLSTICILSATAGKNTKSRVQIGIKKRSENCSMKARKGDLIHVHYRGTLKDGAEFDSSYSRNKAFTLTLGVGQVIKGWEQGLVGMCVGETRRIVIPPELGYGKKGAGDKIPPDSTLIFEVELEKIDRPDSEL